MIDMIDSGASIPRLEPVIKTDQIFNVWTIHNGSVDIA